MSIELRPKDAPLNRTINRTTKDDDSNKCSGSDKRDKKVKASQENTKAEKLKNKQDDLKVSFKVGECKPCKDSPEGFEISFGTESERVAPSVEVKSKPPKESTGLPLRTLTPSELSNIVKSGVPKPKVVLGTPKESTELPTATFSGLSDIKKDKAASADPQEYFRTERTLLPRRLVADLRKDKVPSEATFAKAQLRAVSLLELSKILAADAHEEKLTSRVPKESTKAPLRTVTGSELSQTIKTNTPKPEVVPVKESTKSPLRTVTLSELSNIVKSGVTKPKVVPGASKESAPLRTVTFSELSDIKKDKAASAQDPFGTEIKKISELYKTRRLAAELRKDKVPSVATFAKAQLRAVSLLELSKIIAADVNKETAASADSKESTECPLGTETFLKIPNLHKDKEAPEVQKESTKPLLKTATLSALSKLIEADVSRVELVPETPKEPIPSPTQRLYATLPKLIEANVNDSNPNLELRTDSEPDEPEVAIMEHVVLLDRPCLFRLADLIKQYKSWKAMYPEYLSFKTSARGPQVDPPHRFSASHSHTDEPTCVCRVCIANRKTIDLLDNEGVTFDHVLDAAIDSVRTRLTNIIMSQLRISFLQKKNVYLDLNEGFEAIVPPLSVLRFEKLFKELYEAGMLIVWEILRKLSLIAGCELNYKAAIHFITYLFESADKYMEVCDRLEPHFICFDWKLLHYGLYFKVFLLHFFQEFVFQRPEIIGTWTICYDIVRNSRLIRPNRPGEMSSRQIMAKYDSLVTQMNAVKQMWEAKDLPFKFEEVPLPIHNVLKICSLFPPYRPLSENVKMMYTAEWSDETEQYEIGKLLVGMESNAVDLDPVLDVCLTNPKNKDEKVCVQVLCKDKPIVEETTSFEKPAKLLGIHEPFKQAAKKLFGLDRSKIRDPVFSKPCDSEPYEEQDDEAQPSKPRTSNNKSTHLKDRSGARKGCKNRTGQPRYAVNGKGGKQAMVLNWVHSQKKIHSSFCHQFEKHGLNGRWDHLTGKHAKAARYLNSRLSQCLHHTALQDVLSFAMQIGANAVASMSKKVRENPNDCKFYVAIHYSKCLIPETVTPKVLVPMDQILSILYGTLYKHSLLTDEERKSSFFKLFQGNEINRATNPKAPNITFDAANVNLTLSAHHVTPVQKSSDAGGTSPTEDVSPTVTTVFKKASDTDDRNRIKHRLLEAFKPLVDFMEPKLADFSDASKKGFDDLAPTTETLHQADCTQEATEATVPTSIHVRGTQCKKGTPFVEPVRPSQPPSSASSQTQKESTLSKAKNVPLKTKENIFKGKVLKADEQGDTYMGISRADPVWNRPPVAGVSITVTAEKSSVTTSRRSSTTDDYEDHVCGVLGCNDHSMETHVHTHTHGCIGGSHADPNCECCKNGHTIAAMMRPEDCKRCTSQMSGLPVHSKYPQMRQRMLKTLNQRRDGGEEVDVNGVTAKLQKATLNPVPKAVNKKEIVVVTKSTPPIEDVDALVSMIEGTKISADPKKAAKRARQKEKKMQVQKEEDERRLKLEEEERRLEELRQKEEEERRLVEEAARLERERIESLAKKSKKKKKKKNKISLQESSVSMQTIIETDCGTEEASVQTPAVDDCATKSISGSKRKNKEVVPKDSIKVDMPQPTMALPEEKSDKPTEMVTIRRHPTVPDTTVTISMKSNSGHEDVLYTLINGQVYETEGADVSKEQGHNSELGKAKSSKKKKKKSRNKDSNDISKSNERGSTTQGAPTNNVQEAVSQSKTESMAYGDRHRGKSFSFLNNIPPETEIDLSKLKLPPGITITKVNQHVSPNRGFIRGIPDKQKEISKSPPYQVQVSENTFSDVPSPFYGDVFKKPSVIVVDAHYPNKKNDIPNDDYLTRFETEKFKEVVSTKTRRMRNRAQRSKDDDIEDVDYSEPDGSGLSEAGVCDFNTNYTRPYNVGPSYTRRVGYRPKVVNVGGQSSNPPEYKAKMNFPPSSNTGSARNYSHPSRGYRSQQLGSQDSSSVDENSSGMNSRSRISNSTNNTNIIPRYVKARENMNNMNGLGSDSYGVVGKSVSSTSPVHQSGQTVQMPYGSPTTTLTANSFDPVDSWNEPTFSTNQDEYCNDEPKLTQNNNHDSRWNSTRLHSTTPQTEMPNIMNRWEAILKESYGPTFGPFTVQAGDRKTTWSPWGELSGTEGSSPDNNSSRPHSCDLLPSDVKIDTGSNHCSSPVQRPTPIPIGVPPVGVNPGSVSQATKKQLLINPIARPLSRNSRPESMLSDRSSAEDVRVTQQNNSPAIVNNVRPAMSSTPFGVRDLLASGSRQSVFGDMTFTPGNNGVNGHGYLNPELPVGVNPTGRSTMPIGSRPQSYDFCTVTTVSSSNGNEHIPSVSMYSNMGYPDFKRNVGHVSKPSVSTAEVPSYHWGKNDNRNDSSGISLLGLDNRPYVCPGLNPYPIESSSYLGDAPEPYGCYQQHQPQANDGYDNRIRTNPMSLPNHTHNYHGQVYTNMEDLRMDDRGHYRLSKPDDRQDHSGDPFYPRVDLMAQTHRAIGAERGGKSRMGANLGNYWPGNFDEQ